MTHLDDVNISLCKKLSSISSISPRLEKIVTTFQGFPGTTGILRILMVTGTLRNDTCASLGLNFSNFEFVKNQE